MRVIRSEKSIKRSCINWLLKKYIPKTGVNPDKFWVYCPADRFRSGIPDLLIIFKGRTGWVEFKSENGRVSEIQKYEANRLVLAGAEGAICRSLEEFKKFIFIFFSIINTEDVSL